MAECGVSDQPSLHPSVKGSLGRGLLVHSFFLFFWREVFSSYSL